mmetsp:Transcript_36579/g.95766  ORF Transcript_36579/g.95766 Transcript_36579/m.95766 type:complete len:377 (+) Transcript_36579:196-1326(+)
MDAGPAAVPGPAVLSIDWNEDNSCFAVCTEVGFSVWQSDPMTALCHRDVGGVGHVGLFHRTSLLVLVGGGKDPFDSPNKAVLWDDVKCRVVGYVEFRLPILRVQRRKDLLVVATATKVYAYHLAIVKGAMSDPPTLLYETDAGDNRRGLFCVHAPPGGDTATAVHPTTAAGSVCVSTFSTVPPRVGAGEEATTSSPPALIEAHRHPLVHLSMAPSGALLATASESGTVIKVFEIESGGLLHVLRAQFLSTTIASISFNRSATLLCGTFGDVLHVFKLTRLGATVVAAAAKSYVEWVSAYVPLPKVEGVPSAAQTRLPGPSACVFLPDAGSALAVCTNGSALRFRLMLADAKLQMSEFHKLQRRDEKSDFLKMLDFA